MLIRTLALCLITAVCRNVRIECEPVPIEVATAPGEYTGPRILALRAAGPNFILIREDGIMDVFDAQSGTRVAAHQPEGLNLFWPWTGARPNFSPDGRTIAYCKARESPIVIQNLYGDPPAIREIAAPTSVEVGKGGFSARRFSLDGTQLYCSTNHYWATMDLATGKAVRTVWLQDHQWSEISPDGGYAAVIDSGFGRLVIHDLDDAMSRRDADIDGHGESMTLSMGLAGAYLTDTSGNSVAYVPYAGGEARTFEADGGGADFIGETADGTLVALAWPSSDNGMNDEPTTVAVFRVADAERLVAIPCEAPTAAALLSNPPRLVLLARSATGEAVIPNLAESAEIRDAATGTEIAKFDLTPPAGYMDTFAGKK